MYIGIFNNLDKTTSQYFFFQILLSKRCKFTLYIKFYTDPEVVGFVKTI